MAELGLARRRGDPGRAAGRHFRVGQRPGPAATICEAVALEVRHGQRTEVAELAEAFRCGPEGLVGHAAQRNLIPVLSGSPDWPGSSGPRSCRWMEGIPLWQNATSRIPRPSGSRARRAITTDFLLRETTPGRGLEVNAERMRGTWSPAMA